jgi:SAM-dependent methyltransferase
MSGSAEDALERLEEFISRQAELPPETYDDSYFTHAWREGENRYDLDTRRRIEGRNPALIDEVFAPQRVLDAGCGPGFLLFLLAELGVSAEGIDLSPHSQALAPPEVAGQIRVCPITAIDAPERTYDLVVCREVLEHLTVPQVRRAVSELCRVSSRHVYLTTRFHPGPAHPFDAASEPEVDPTHITLMTKELLRCLFVLEGFRRRADLEERMDWAGKGRVLVYERPS